MHAGYLIGADFSDSGWYGGTSASSDAARQAIEDARAEIYKGPFENHHVGAQASLKGVKSRNVIIRLFGNIHVDINLTKLPSVFHWQLHTDAYYEWVDQQIMKAITGNAPENVQRTLEKIKGLLHEGFSPKY